MNKNTLIYKYWTGSEVLLTFIRTLACFIVTEGKVACWENTRTWASTANSLVVKLHRNTASQFLSWKHTNWPTPTDSPNYHIYIFTFPQCSFVINQGNSVSPFIWDNGSSQVVNSGEDVVKCICSLWKTTILYSRKTEPCLIKINTYFRVALSPPTHGLISHTIGLLMARHSATLFAP